jgi:general secretion pathway protein A
MGTVSTLGQPGRAEGYEPFFGLNEAPFSLAPDPRFLFASASHSAALAQVVYALQRREPLVVITGEIGTGKTLLCRTVLQKLRGKTFLSVIDDPLLQRDDLLKQLLQDFGVVSKDRTTLTEVSRHELAQTLQTFLRSLAPIQAHAVVIIDEAQHLQPDVLEQIRLLSNIDDERGTLLQIILVGQTDLEPLLSRPELRQLQQRVSRRLPLEPLNRDEVEQYIQHRLALARVDKPRNQTPDAADLARELAAWAGTTPRVEFTPDSIHAVTQLSGGVPRVINLLCDRSLEEAYAYRLRTIDSRLIHSAARALGIGEQAAPTTPANLNVTPRSTQVRPDESPWTVTRSESEKADEIVQRTEEAVPVAFRAHTRPAVSPRVVGYLGLAIFLALAIVAIVLIRRPARPPVAQAPSTAAASSATPTAGARPDRAPAGVSALAPKPAATAPAPAPPQAGASPSSSAVATATGERFDIVVASFRTDSRATSVAAQVAALGLPVRRRVSDGWRQVVSGPFTSRTNAEDARERLRRGGLAGAQIVLIAR